MFLKESGCQTKLSNYPNKSYYHHSFRRMLIDSQVAWHFSEYVPNKMHLNIKQKTVWWKITGNDMKKWPPETFQFWALGIWPWWILCAGPCMPRASLKLVPRDRTVPWQRWDGPALKKSVAYGEVDGRKSLEVVVAMVPIPYYLKSTGIDAWTMFVRHWHCSTAPQKSWVLYTGIIWNLPEFKVIFPGKNRYDLPTTHGRSKFGTKIAWFGDGNEFKNLGKMLLQKIGSRI